MMETEEIAKRIKEILDTDDWSLKEMDMLIKLHDDITKINHEMKCQHCGKPAEVNYQKVWVSWDITPDGNFEHEEYHDCDENEFYCSECWNKFQSGELE